MQWYLILEDHLQSPEIIVSERFDFGYELVASVSGTWL